MQQKPLYSNPIINASMNPGQQTQKSFADLAKNKNPYNSEFIGLGKDQTNLFGYKVPDEIIKAQEEMMKKNPINMFNMASPAELGEQLDMGKYEGNPNFQAAMQMSNAGMKIDPFGMAELKEPKPQPELLGAFNPVDQYTGDDPFVKGYLGSDFYNDKMTTNVVPYTYQGKEMKGSGSDASNFKKYLESIGKGDLIQFPDQGIMTQELGKVSGPEDSLTAPPTFATPGLPSPINIPEGEMSPIKTAGPSGIESLQNQYKNPYQNNNNNMSNFKNMEKLLQNIDGGIQSLIDNSSYMQSNNNLSQFPFSNSSSPNFMGGDILKWSSYK